MPQRQDRVVLAHDAMISTRSLRIDRSNISKQKTRGVDVVHQYLIDQESRELTKIRLFRIGLITRALADPAAESIVERNSNIAPGDDRAAGTVPGLPPPVVVNHDPDAMALG